MLVTQSAQYGNDVFQKICRIIINNENITKNK